MRRLHIGHVLVVLGLVALVGLYAVGLPPDVAEGDQVPGGVVVGVAPGGISVQPDGHETMSLLVPPKDWAYCQREGFRAMELKLIEDTRRELGIPLTKPIK